MIGDGKKYHYLAVTNLSGLLQGNSSNHEGDFYCSNCFNSYTTKNSCHIETPKWVEKISKYNPGEKSLKAPFAIYLDLECLLKNVQSSQNNPEKSHTEKKLDMKLLIEHCLQDVHLIKKKINLIITNEKIVLKNYVKN